MSITLVRYVEMRFMEIKITGNCQKPQARERLDSLLWEWLKELGTLHDIIQAGYKKGMPLYYINIVGYNIGHIFCGC